MKNKQGFTLIEMLIVIVILVLLAGMVFRMVAGIGKSNDIAATRAKIEKVANALEEFRAIYGKYPPVSQYEGMGQPTEYEFPGSYTFKPSVVQQILNSDRNKQIRWKKSDDGTANSGRIYTFGLVSFLVPRYNGAAEYGAILFTGNDPNNNSKQNSELGIRQWANFNKKNGGIGDSDRDIAAARRILPHLGAKMGDDNRPVKDGGNIGVIRIDIKESFCHSAGINGVITNSVYKLEDAWYRSLNYRSLPPYDSYKLWSNGPDGVEGTADDIVAGVY